MIEHTEWCGPDLGTGIQGQRIAIVGHSHYRDEGSPDHDNFTVDILRRVIKEDHLPFFSKIRECFNEQESGTFWNRALFFNFIPECVGTRSSKYAYGTPQQIQRGQDRLLRLIAQYTPDKMLVFTTKGWDEFPPTLEEAAGQPLVPLSPELSRFTMGTYRAGDHTVHAFGLRHPERAGRARLQQAVQQAMAISSS